MKKRIQNLIYLITRNQQVPNTQNINTIVNKIPCDHESFFKLTPAESYALRQMGKYPATTEQKEELFKVYTKEQKKPNDGNKIATLLVDLPSAMSYLQIEQARDWLKQLDHDELKHHQQNLKLLQSHLQQTLEDGNYENHVEQSVQSLIEQLSQAHQTAASKVV